MRLANGSVNGYGTTVVGGEHEEPVAEFPVQIFQVFSCGSCAFIKVSPFVGVMADFETEHMGSAGH